MLGRSLAVAAVVCMYVCPAYAEPTDEELKKAAALFEQAEKEFKIGEYQLSLSDYKAAYLLSGEPALLFNIGQCHRFLNNDAEATKSYKTFLRDANPDANQRAIAEKLIAEIEAKGPAEQSATIEAHSASGTEGAILFIDGTSVGPLPVSTTLKTGRHTFELRRDNLILYTESVELKPGESRSLSISLGKEAGNPLPVAEGVLLRFETSLESRSYLVSLQTTSERLVCPQPVEKGLPCELRTTSTGGAKLTLRGSSKLSQAITLPNQGGVMDLQAPKNPTAAKPLIIAGAGVALVGIILRVTSPFDPFAPPPADPQAPPQRGENRFFAGATIAAVGIGAVVVGGAYLLVRKSSTKKYGQSHTTFAPLPEAR